MAQAEEGPGAREAQRERLGAIAALIGGALVIAAAPILVRLAGAGPAAVGFWRLVFALPLLALLCWRSGKGPGRPTPLIAAAGVLFALDLAFWHYGIHFTSVANATVLANLNPILVTLGAWLLLRERPRPVFLAGMAAAVAGAILMALANSRSVGPGARPLLGDVLSALTAVWYSLYFLAVRGERARRSTAQIMVWTSLIGAPLLLLAAAILGERLTPPTPAGWWALAGLGATQVVGQGAIAWALGRIQAAAASLIILLQPVAAALLAWLLFGEALTPLQAAGGILAMAGIAFAQLRGTPAPATS